MAAVMATFPLAGCGGGSGDAASPAPVPVAPPPTVRTFAYVANYSSGDVSVYRVDASDALIPVGTTPAEPGAASVVVHPSGRFAYVLYDDGQHHISTYTVDPATGMLTFSANAAFDDGPVEMLIHPAGNFAYVRTPDTQSIVICTIDSGTGALTASTPFAVGVSPLGMAIDSVGRFLYVTTAHSVTSYAISESGGLTLHSTAITGQFPRQVAVSISGKVVYVATTEGIATHEINPEGGLGTPTLVEANNLGPFVLDPSGRFLFAYTIPAAIALLSVYAIHPDSGALTSGNSVILDAEPFSLAVSPSSQTLYMAGGQTVVGYGVHQGTGALTEPRQFQAGDDPSGITIVNISQ